MATVGQTYNFTHLKHETDLFRATRNDPFWIQRKIDYLESDDCKNRYTLKCVAVGYASLLSEICGKAEIILDQINNHLTYFVGYIHMHLELALHLNIPGPGSKQEKTHQIETEFLRKVTLAALRAKLALAQLGKVANPFDPDSQRLKASMLAKKENFKAEAHAQLKAIGAAEDHIETLKLPVGIV